MGDIEAVIDTGYNGFLTMPPMLVRDLGLPFVTNGQAILANGGEATFDIHSVTMVLDGQPRGIDVYVSDTAPLRGHAVARRSQPVRRCRERRACRH